MSRTLLRSLTVTAVAAAATAGALGAAIPASAATARPACIFVADRPSCGPGTPLYEVSPNTPAAPRLIGCS
jgi:hypothetical protein